MKLKKYLAGTAMMAVAAITLSGCASGSSDAGAASSAAAQTNFSGQTLTLWDYEDDTSAMAIAWNAAIKILEEETGATVKVENKSFEQINKTAAQVLNSDEAPDILEYNKGNATAGYLASQGLLTNLDSAVAQYGWDKKLSSSLQTTMKYSEDGVMGSGSWYGVSDYGEFVGAYYNKDLFKKYDIAIPTTYDEFVSALAKFKAAGVTPISTAGQEYPTGQLWYQLALTKADRQWVNDYQLYQNQVDWSGEPVTFASQTLQDWTNAGYISKDSTGLKAEDAGVSFINGDSPIFVSGSWWYGRMISDISSKFDWELAQFPGSNLSLGSSGNLWVIPANSEHAALAEYFIDITLRPEIQAIIGNNGGVPVAANTADITDAKSKQLITVFNSITSQDGLAYYPDWPTPTFYTELNSALQGLVNGTKTVAETNATLKEKYESYASDFWSK